MKRYLKSHKIITLILYATLIGALFLFRQMPYMGEDILTYSLIRAIAPAVFGLFLIIHPILYVVIYYRNRPKKSDRDTLEAQQALEQEDYNNDIIQTINQNFEEKERTLDILFSRTGIMMLLTFAFGIFLVWLQMDNIRDCIKDYNKEPVIITLTDAKMKYRSSRKRSSGRYTLSGTDASREYHYFSLGTIPNQEIMDAINTKSPTIQILCCPNSDSPVSMEVQFDDGSILSLPEGRMDTNMENNTSDTTNPDSDHNSNKTWNELEAEEAASTQETTKQEENASTQEERRGEADAYEELDLEDIELYGVQIGDSYGDSKFTLKQNGYDDMYYAVLDGYEAYSNALKQIKERYSIPDGLYCDILIQKDGDIELILVFDLETEALTDIVARKRVE